MKILFEDPELGRQDVMVKFPPGYREPVHTHASSHSICVLEGKMCVAGRNWGRGITSSAGTRITGPMSIRSAVRFSSLQWGRASSTGSRRKTNSSSGSGNFQLLPGLGGRGDELGILRHWNLRGWGGKIRPAASYGGKVLSSGTVCSRPRLPALTARPPKPSHGGGQ